MPTLELLDSVLAKTEYLTLYDEKDEEDRNRLENIKELRSVAVEFPNISQFLENVALVEQEYLPDKPLNGEKADAVNLMTLHAAKGLEFPAVFMVGMEEGLFPHSRSAMDRSELEEERRLCYVGMTRAMEKLFLTYSRKRLFFGQRQSNIVSRFILELPEKTLADNAYIFDRKSEEYL
ncbi:MAG: 3'-5' exonuclease [Nanoarchaeota archaeon]